MTISSLGSNDLPWAEDVFNLYSYKTLENTFPSLDFTTYFLAISHIIGVIFIYLGILLPPRYIWIHTLYIGILAITYIIFNNNCFMTLLTNVNTDQFRNPLYIRMSTALKLLGIVFFISLTSNFYPKYSPFEILKHTMLALDGTNT